MAYDSASGCRTAMDSATVRTNVRHAVLPDRASTKAELAFANTNANANSSSVKSNRGHRMKGTKQ